MPESTPMRIGVFGGTFDPPHYGHLAAALDVRHALDLDRVLFVVANDPWQKSPSRAVAAPAVRLELVRAAIDGYEGLEASSLELQRGGESYTADTLAELRSIHPGAELMLMVGSDAAAGLRTWKRPEEILRLSTTVVFGRPGGAARLPLAFGAVTDHRWQEEREPAMRASRNPEEPGLPSTSAHGGVGGCWLSLPQGWPAVRVDVPELNISASDLRARFADGRPVEALTPRAVVDVVRSHGLYGSRR